MKGYFLIEIKFMISWRRRYFSEQPGNIIRTIFTIGKKVEDVFFVLGYVALRKLFCVQPKCVTNEELKNSDEFSLTIKNLSVQ